MRLSKVRHHSHPRRWLPAVLGLALLATPGCGGEDPEQRLEQAGRALADARAEVEEARTRVQDAKAVVENAEQELEDARKQLRGAEKRLAEVEERVDLRATDAALFRSIQSRLLQDGTLENVAIAARVEKGVVVLSGTVSKPEQRERALAIARSTPGVAAVESRIEVAGQAPAPTKKPSG